jgi:DNA-binding CsgD family transcriptional regulator
MANVPDPSLVPADAPFFVGRERERRLLGDRLRAALDGRGGLALVGGAAGIGKTALARVVGDEAAARDIHVLAGRCYDLADAPPYGPWRDLLAGGPAATGLSSSAPVAGAFPDDMPSQMALFAHIRDSLSAIAARRPLLLVLEDLHWADPASLDLLRFLGHAAHAAPLLILATYRGDELDRAHPLYRIFPALVRDADATRIDLHPLAEDDIRALVHARYALADADERRLVAYLTVRSEGNPLFLGELARTLEEEGFMRQGDDGWGLGDLSRARVPLLLRQLIDRRLTRFGAAGERLLALAAVIGQEVPLALWGAVAGTDEETLLDLVDRAVAAHVVEEAEEGTAIRFAHALIRETLYEGASLSRRRAWHRQIAEVLAATSDPDPHAVAHHFGRAGDARAAAWLVQAGEEAQRTYAWVTAAARYEAALDLLPETDATARTLGWLHFYLGQMAQFIGLWRDRAHLGEAIEIAERAGDQALAAVARLYHGTTRYHDGDARGGIAEVRSALAILAALSDAELALLYARRQMIDRAFDKDQGRGLLAWCLANTGAFAEAQTLAEEVTDDQGAANGDILLTRMLVSASLGMPDAAREAAANARAAYAAVGAFNEVVVVLWLEQAWLLTTYWPDHPEERRRVRAELEALWEKSSAAALSGVPIAIMLLPSAVIEGRWEEVRALARQFPLGGVTVEIIPRTVLGQIAFAQGEHDLVLNLAREVLPDGPATEPGGSSFLMAMALQRLAAAVALDAGDRETARAWLEAHDRWLAGSGAVLGRADADLGWAAYFRAAGDQARAEARAMQALAHATEPRQPLALLAAHRLLGEIDTVAGRHEDAAIHLDAALALADACAAPYERALTLLALAELRLATGRRAEAGDFVDEARAICLPLGATPALARADALAASISTEKIAPPTYPAGLSAREVEVLRLVAEGLTDGQVADELFLSPRTVGRHLTSIYRKLGVASRAAATRFAVEHRLT